MDIGADVLEQEARRRAVEGVSEPVYYMGAEVGSVQKYSDTLMCLLLKGHKPQKYRERTDLNVTGMDVVTAAMQSAMDRAKAQTGKK